MMPARDRLRFGAFIIGAVLSFAGTHASAADLPEDFVYLRDVDPTILQDMRYAGSDNFTGTRVPVQTLLDYLESGDSIDEFLAGFPSVSRSQAIEFLEQAKDRLVATVS